MKHDQTLGLLSSSPVVAEQVRVILELLSERQYVRPHSLLDDVLSVVGTRLGLDPLTMRRAAVQSHLNPELSIGRVGRAQLVELARHLAT